MCYLSSAGDKPLDSCATNASSSRSNNRVNTMTLGYKIANHSVLLILFEASEHQVQQ